MNESMRSVTIARQIDRPSAKQFIDEIFDDFLEFHGDRLFGDDGAIVGGIAGLNGMPVTVIGIQKGHTLEENVNCNFGQPNPEGYRKALRLMKQAEKFHRPVITLINTAGAFPGVGAEERGQGEAIARNLMEMSRLKTPVISIFIGEGGSGGALALAVGDQVWMLEHAVYSILSPEGFSSILWKDPTRVAEAAERMKMTARDLLENHVADRMFAEPEDGLEHHLPKVAAELKQALTDILQELLDMDTEELLRKRYEHFRQFGNFME